MSTGALLDRQTSRGCAVLTLTQPERGNALSEAMVEAMMQAIAQAIDDAAVHTLVLQGAGRNFCTGFDLGAVDADAAPGRGPADTDGPLLWRFVRVEQLLALLWHAPLRTVAVAHGRAWGAGADLFAACDLRVASGGASWRFPGPRFGLVLGTRRLASHVGDTVALDWVAHGRSIDTATALRHGLVTATCDPAAGWSDLVPGDAVDRPTYAQLKAAVRPDRRDADLAALVRSACRPGLGQRVRDYVAATRKPAP